MPDQSDFRFRELLDQERPLWMPPGSVRSLIALAIVAGYLAGVVDQLEVVLLTIGFYFGSRGAEEA